MDCINLVDRLDCSFFGLEVATLVDTQGLRFGLGYVWQSWNCFNVRLAGLACIGSIVASAERNRVGNGFFGRLSALRL